MYSNLKYCKVGVTVELEHCSLKLERIKTQ